LARTDPALPSALDGRGWGRAHLLLSLASAVVSAAVVGAAVVGAAVVGAVAVGVGAVVWRRKSAVS